MRMGWINLAGTSISSGLMQVYKAINGRVGMCVPSPQNFKKTSNETRGNPFKADKGKHFLVINNLTLELIPSKDF